MKRFLKFSFGESIFSLFDLVIKESHNSDTQWRAASPKAHNEPMAQVS